MDIKTLRIVLSKETNYQDMGRDKFLDLLEEVFDKFREFGDTKLEFKPGKCNGCYKGCKGVSFFGNNSRNYIDFVVLTEDDDILGAITEICECSDFTTFNIYDLKKNRVYLDDGEDFQNWLNTKLDGGL
jgi:hypothetical protein